MLFRSVGLMPWWSRAGLRLPWLPVAERTVVRAAGSAAVGTIRWAMTPPAVQDPRPGTDHPNGPPA